MEMDLLKRFVDVPATAAMTESFSDLSLDCPPGKISRRNALTERDVFPMAEMMQRLEDLNEEAILREEKNYLSSSKHRRARKKAIPRNDLSDNAQQQQLMSICLHDDVKNLRPKGLLPAAIVDHYSKKETNALVLYKPPGRIVAEILAKTTQTAKTEDRESSNEEEDDNEALESEAVGPIEVDMEEG